MLVYRLCEKEEIDSIWEKESFADVGSISETNPKRSTHSYDENKRYLHFFGQLVDLVYLFLEKGKCICVYDIPEDMLEKGKGIGYYLDYVFFEKRCSCEEYAIPVEDMRFEYLNEIRVIEETADYEEIITSLPVDDFSKVIYEKGEPKSKRLQYE